MNNDQHQVIPLPLAMVLAVAGAGGGGVGTWLTLAAQAASHPDVQRSAVAATNVAGDAAVASISGAMKARSIVSQLGASTTWFLLGLAVATAVLTALTAACICGGCFGGASAWVIASRIRHQNRIDTCDLAALAQQIEAGGQTARSAAARSLGATEADIDTWVQDWRRAAVGLRKHGRNGPRL